MARSRTTFQKGVSGNPTGMPKLNPELRARIVAEVPAALAACLVVMRDPEAEHRDILAAVRLIFEWGIAKPAPDLGDDNTGRLQVLLDALKG